jgi:hypothetical protein
MMHLSLPKDISEEQMLDVIAAIEKSNRLSHDQSLTLELDGIAIATGAGQACSRLDYCQALQRLINSGLF